MAHSYESYQARCNDAARHFLQSVVVIDNQAQLYPDEWERSLRRSDSDRSLVKKKLSSRPAAGLSNELIHRDTEPQEESTKVSLKEAPSSKSGGDKTHLLRAWPLMEKFADKEILCTIYRPDDYEDNGTQDVEKDDAKSHPTVIRSAKMARLADIVVLDWELGGSNGDKGTWKAREIIKAILDDDNQSRGRQRLIAIYSATPNLRAIFSDVIEDIGSIDYVGGKLITNMRDLSLSNKTTRVVLLNKDTKITDPRNRSTVSEEDLPPRLIAEFVTLNRGLLPNIALHSIASIRETTHHILSTFNSDLDPALVSHRSLLPNPQDSEEFILDLISSEFRSVLSLNRIGEENAGVDAHKDWIAGHLKNRESFDLKKYISVMRQEANELVSIGGEEFESVVRAAALRWAKEVWSEGKKIKHDLITQPLTQKAVKALIKTGTFKDLRKQIKAPLLDFKQLTGIFAGNKDKGTDIDYKFSRLTALKREYFGARHLPDRWLPKLTQGSIIRQIKKDDSLSNEFLLCIQPRCDSVRIIEETPFPFLIMTTNKVLAATKQFLIVKCRKEPGLDPENIKLWLCPAPCHQKMLSFDPSASSGDHIQAVFENNVFVFKSDGKEYEWIADMRDFMAQKICDQLSGRQGTVGLDEYEWLRRMSKT